MKKITKPLKQIEIFIGTQEINKSIDYRWNNMLIKEKVDGGHLIYNSITKEMLFLSEEELELVKNSISPISLNYLSEYLLRNWFLVPIDFSEVLVVEQLRNVLRLYESKDVPITHYTILTTTGCNARCFYCFQAGVPVKVMDEKTALDVAKYIEKKSKGKSVTLHWFGGEPLCNCKAIRVICNYLNKKAIKFESVMTSNSTIFTQTLIEEAVNDWKLKTIQITIDGMADTYNKAKNFIDKKTYNFDRLIKNMETICQFDIYTQVRLNMDLYNSDELWELVDFLNEKFGHFEKFSIYVSPIYEDVGFEAINRTDEQRAELNEKLCDLWDHLFSLRTHTREMHFDVIKTRACHADKPETTIIVPDGHLCYCEHYISTEFYGTIYDDANKMKWCEYRPLQKECYKCAAYSSCLLMAKCPNALKPCYDFDRYIKIVHLRTGMINKYNKYLKNEEKQCE